MKKGLFAIVLTLVLSLTLVFSLGSGFAANGVASQDNADDQSDSNVMTLATSSAVFTDVPTDAWYAEAIAYCQQNGLMEGTTTTTFEPNAVLSRAMLVTILHRTAGTPSVTGTTSFSDVANGTWYSDAVTWASQNNIISGYGNNRFGTNDPITREQLITILWRYGGNADVASNPSFADIDKVSSWAGDAVAWGSEKDIVNAKDGNQFAPKDNAIRAEAAFMLKQFLSPSIDADASAVYMTTDISAEGLLAIYEALNFKASGNVAVKVHTGESENSNHLRPELIKKLVQSVDGTIVESNTAYGGNRASTAMHLQLAKDHGFTEIANVDIMDADGEIALPVVGGTNLTENFVGASFNDYDFFVILSHFKGHAMGGFGGAIKNISIGIASSGGKSWIHSAGTSKSSPWGGDQDKFLESMAEAGKSVSDSLDGKILYINVMNRLSVDCDCNGNPAEPDMHDIGVLASLDPVALDKACVDLVYAAPDGQSLIARMESRNAIHTLEHGEKIGLGNQTYALVNIDD